MVTAMPASRLSVPWTCCSMTLAKKRATPWSADMTTSVPTQEALRTLKPLRTKNFARPPDAPLGGRATIGVTPNATCRSATTIMATAMHAWHQDAPLSSWPTRFATRRATLRLASSTGSCAPRRITRTILGTTLRVLRSIATCCHRRALPRPSRIYHQCGSGPVKRVLHKRLLLVEISILTCQH